MPHIQVDALGVEVRYKRVKNLIIRVHRPDGHVSVSVPYFTATSLIEALVRSKMSWILAQRQTIQQTPAPASTVPHIGDTVPLWGQRFILQHASQLRAGVVWEEPYCRIDQHEPAHIEKRLNQAYHRAVSAAVPTLLAAWQPRLGVNVQRFFVRQMRSRWGSCTYQQQSIRLNSELAKYPPECLEYVVVHELVHLLEPSHNARFYQLQAHFLPDFKVRKSRLTQPPLLAHPLDDS